jgi:hypothetical protein
MQFRKVPTSPLEIQLSRETVHRAAALSIARYFILLATSIIVLIIRGILLWKFTPSLALRIVVLLAEIGRWIVVVTQTGSVLTYSCQFKAVGTWFSPVDKTPTGSFWDPSTQHAFRSCIWENMSNMWHAKTIFWITEKTVVAITGRPYFSKFTSPSQTEYEAENGAADLDLLVYDDDMSDGTPQYTIRFRNTPRMVLACLQNPLYGNLGQKLLFGVPALVLGFFGVVAPVLFGYFDPGDPKAKYYWFVEQIVVGLVKYYDWEDWGINTTFGKGVALTLEHQSARMARVPDDGTHGSVIAESSTAPQSLSPSAVHTEEDIAETEEIEMRGIGTSYLKAAIGLGESAEEPVR